MQPRAWKSVINALAVLAALTFGCGQSPIEAAELDLPTDPYPYVAVEQKVADALTAMGRHAGISTLISDKVEGVIRGHIPSGDARQFLDAIAETYGLAWYYDGAVLEIVSKTEIRTSMIALRNVTPLRLKVALKTMGLWDGRFLFSYDPILRLAHISGTPHYLETVTKVAEKLEKTYPRSVRVLRGGKTGAEALSNQLELSGALGSQLTQPLN